MTIVKDLPLNERPREKAIQYGFSVLSSRELLAIILRAGIHHKSALEIADELLCKTQGVRGLARISAKELKEIKGIKDAKALELLACFELTKRLTYEEALEKDVVNQPEVLTKWLRHQLGNSLQEEFLVVYLDAANHIIKYKILFKGTCDASMVSPREVFKEAYLNISTKMILVHNHPSGNLVPSQADIQLTKRMIEISKIMNVQIIDHIIVASHGYFSFAKEGLL